MVRFSTKNLQATLKPLIAGLQVRSLSQGSPLLDFTRTLTSIDLASVFSMAQFKAQYDFVSIQPTSLARFEAFLDPLNNWVVWDH